jgi:hypothetical protein
VLVLLMGGFLKYAVRMASGGMIYMPSSISIDSDIQEILRLLPRHSETVQCWYY